MWFREGIFFIKTSELHPTEESELEERLGQKALKKEPEL